MGDKMISIGLISIPSTSYAPYLLLHKYFIFYFDVKLPWIIFMVDRDVSIAIVVFVML